MALTNSDIQKLAKILGKKVSDKDIDTARNNISGGQVQGASTFQGADGKQIPYRNEIQAETGGVYGEEAAANASKAFSGGGAVSVPRVSKEEEAGIFKQYGLEGLTSKDASLVGLTKEQANARAKGLSDKLKSQTSALTSSVVNPDSIAKSRKQFDALNFRLDLNNDDPLIHSRERKEKNQALVDSFTDQIAKSFASLEEFNAARQDPTFAGVLKDFERKGGDANAIGAKITSTPVVTPETTGDMSVDEYLGTLDTASEKRALESLIPERDIAQAEISFQQSIPEQYQASYFGTPEQVGFIEQQKKLAQEEIKILERKAKIDEKNARAQVDYAISKNNAEMAIESAQIEENRLAAKNYMTGMLAKLGALNTTGAAPQALANLEQKYQTQAQQLRTSYQFANKELQLKLTEEVDNIGLDRDTEILKVNQDLNKTEEEAWKEVIKLQNDADQKTFKILSDFAKDFRTQTDKYAAEAKRDAEKYAKEFAKKASSYSTSGVSLSGKGLSFSEFIKEKEGERKQSIGGEGRQELVPEFLQALINSGSISTGLESVLNGNTSISGYIPKAVSAEMTKLGITKDMLKNSVPEEVDEDAQAVSAAEEAAAAIESGADPQLVKREFLKEFPKKGALFNSYIGN